ncbi:MAG: hypothetical protein CVU39_03275 [Chloroflexi bacterium HGW-Chloroflexi-10]|nr:MAG: hypothetical protein CVU39_03275 [Chloroflexi bacterium HGW-Chloroflexi-10]
MINLKSQKIIDTIFFSLLLILLTFYYSTLLLVPFHPDEATQIYMSSDVELIIYDIKSIYLRDDLQDPIKQNYRLLDSPLTKYSIGIARFIFQKPALTEDWQWDKSWEENSNALPSTDLLRVARMSTSIFFPGTLFFFYQLTRKIFSKPIAQISVILFASNSIVFLHTRRAMAEGILLFFLVLTLYCLYTFPNKWSFLTAIPVALAINAKQSLIVLAFIALLILIYQHYRHPKDMLRYITLFSSIILFIFYLLNPVIWDRPINGITAMIEKRSELTNNQVNAIESVADKFILNSPLEKIIGFIAQSFITLPAIQDIGNYQEQLASSEIVYTQYLVHKGISRNIFWGGILFVFFVLGFLQTLRSKQPQKIFLCFITILFILEVTILFNIPFQRYYLALYPFIFLFLAIGLTDFFLKIKTVVNKYTGCFLK